jgi:hypothetical protein
MGASSAARRLRWPRRTSRRSSIEERLRNVLARAATHSLDAGLVERYLVNGAGFWVRTVEDKQTVEVILTFDSAYRELAALRAKAWGTTPSEPTDEERATALLVMRAPVDWLLPRPQGYSELRPAAGTPLRPLRGEAMTEPPESEWQRILNCVRTFTGKDMTVGEMAHACNTDTGAIVAALEELGEREAPDS